MEDWDILVQGAGSPAWNMACDEWLLYRASASARPLLRTYAWDRPSITIGYFQPFPAGLSAVYTIVRRPTGGALVYHDSDLTFTVLLRPEHPWCQLRALDRYERVHERIRKLFEVRGVHALLAAETGDERGELSGSRGGREACFEKTSRYDVLVDGKKLAGGAQRVKKEGLLHQGSILPRVSVAELHRAWEACGAILHPWSLGIEDQKGIERLAVEKYGTEEWNRRR